jgi:SAM-dependent methyltransferase
MKQPETWKPTKYELRNGMLCASQDPRQVGIGSRLCANLTARFYDEFIPLHVRGDVCDLGCGFAPLYLKYKPYATSVTLADWSNSLHPNPHLDVACDLNEPLPFDDCSFDTCLLSDVLEHIYEPKQLLRETARCLRPGGKLLCNVPFFYWLHEEPHDYYRYTYYALRRLIAESGLKLIYFEGLGGAREVIADILAKRLCSSKLRLFVANKIQMYCLKHPNKTLSRRQFPLMYTLIAEKEEAQR